jgi:hypothetical protein
LRKRTRPGAMAECAKITSDSHLRQPPHWASRRNPQRARPRPLADLTSSRYLQKDPSPPALQILFLHLLAKVWVRRPRTPPLLGKWRERISPLLKQRHRKREAPSVRIRLPQRRPLHPTSDRATRQRDRNNPPQGEVTQGPSPIIYNLEIIVVTYF